MLLEEVLRDLLASQRTILEVYTKTANIPGDPDLTGVVIIDIGIDFVVFAKNASPTAGMTYVRKSDILGLEVMPEA